MLTHQINSTTTVAETNMSHSEKFSCFYIWSMEEIEVEIYPLRRGESTFVLKIILECFFNYRDIIKKMLLRCWGLE
jgi:hypothetical protein